MKKIWWVTKLERMKQNHSVITTLSQIYKKKWDYEDWNHKWRLLITLEN